MKTLLFFSCIALLFSGCPQKKSVDKPQEVSITSTDTKERDAVRSAISEKESKAAASVAAARRANESNPDGNPKTATEAELNLASQNLPAPSPADLNAALERVNAALRGDLKTAQSSWLKAEKENASLSERLAKAEELAKKKDDENALKLSLRESEWKKAFSAKEAEMRDAVNAERQKAEAEMKRLIGYFFFGFSAICIVAGVACLTVLSSLAFVGPKVIAGLFISAACLSGTGVLLIRAMSSPWISRGVGICAVLAIATLAIAYANHKHGETTATK